MAKKPPPPPVTTALKTAAGPAEIDLSGASTPQQVIFHAMLAYIDTPGLALRQLWNEHRLNDEDDTSPYYRDVISWHTLERAAVKGKWSTRRREHWAAVERRVLKVLQTSHVERELGELKQLEGVESVLLTHITGVTDEHGAVVVAAVRPKSLEGAVGALVNLGKYRDQKRERVNADISRRATHTDDDEGNVITVQHVPTVDDALSDDDIEAMALAIAAKRAGVPVHDEDEDGE